MLLLPNIYYRENTLSIQYPFTLNGHLITKIENYNRYYAQAWQTSTGNGRMFETELIIVNERNQALRIEREILRSLFIREMNNFIRTYGASAQVADHQDITDWGRYVLQRYLQELRVQCDNIRELRQIFSHYSDPLESYRDKLRNQGRLNDSTTTAETLYTGRAIAPNEYRASVSGTYSTAITSTSNPYTNPYISSAVNPYWRPDISSSGTVTFHNGESLDIEPIEPQSSPPVPEYKYIHEYTYKPEYIHHYMPDEDKDATLLLGAEIEVDCGGKSEEHAKKVLEIVCGLHPEESDKPLEDKMYCMHDGSLKSGIEFATMPCSLEYHKQKMKYKEMFEYLDKHGYRAHDTTTCGLHIHANRKYLGKSKLVQQLTISKILYILEKFNDEICVIARRNNDYSKFVGKDEVNESLDKLYGKYYSTGKRVAINLQHKDTIEFRCFRGTLKYETFILTLEFVKNIIDYAKSINIEEIELIQWSDLLNTFSDELKDYYNDRLEKEKNKEKVTVECRVATASANHNHSTIVGQGIVGTLTPQATITIPASGIPDIRASWENINAIVDMTPTPEHPVPIDEQLGQSIMDDIYQSFMNNCNERIISAFYSSTNRNPEDSAIHELKNKISSLKKRIKHSTIPMEKSALQKELNEAQKELKKKKNRQ